MLAWYLAHTAPCMPGSAAIAEMLIRSILTYHKQTLYAYKEGLTWDLLALFTPRPEDFARNYHALHATSDADLEKAAIRYQAFIKNAVTPFATTSLDDHIKVSNNSFSFWIPTVAFTAGLIGIGVASENRDNNINTLRK